MTAIAVLGLGAMGSRMAARLIAAGHDVTVWNRSPAPAAALAAQGARAAATPAQAADGAEAVLSMVYDDNAHRAVWSTPGTGALAGLAKGAVAIDASTVSPFLSRDWHHAVAARGAEALDAPVAGSRPQAEAGALVFLAGGSEAALDRARPILSVLGCTVVHVGPAGAGAVAKLAVNALLAVELATLAEVLGLAARSGTDPARVLEAVGATAVASPSIRAGGAAMLARNFAPAAPIDLLAKDLGIATDLAVTAGAELPLTGAARDVLTALSRAGFGGDNITALIRPYLPDARMTESVQLADAPR